MLIVLRRHLKILVPFPDTPYFTSDRVLQWQALPLKLEQLTQQHFLYGCLLSYLIGEKLHPLHPTLTRRMQLLMLLVVLTDWLFIRHGHVFPPSVDRLPKQDYPPVSFDPQASFLPANFKFQPTLLHPERHFYVTFDLFYRLNPENPHPSPLSCFQGHWSRVDVAFVLRMIALCDGEPAPPATIPLDWTLDAQVSALEAGTHPHNLVRKFHQLCCVSAVGRLIERKSLAQAGGIFANFPQPATYFSRYLGQVCGDTRTVGPDNYFHGTVILTHSKTLSQWSHLLQQQQFQPIHLVFGRQFVLPNHPRTIVLMTHRQLSLFTSYLSGEQKVFNVRIGQSSENVCLLHQYVHRLILADAHVVSPFAKTNRIQRTIRCRVKWVCWNGPSFKPHMLQLFHHRLDISQTVTLPTSIVLQPADRHLIPQHYERKATITPHGQVVKTFLQKQPRNSKPAVQRRIRLEQGLVSSILPVQPTPPGQTTQCFVCLEEQTCNMVAARCAVNAPHTLCARCFENVVVQDTFKCPFCRRILHVSDLCTYRLGGQPIAQAPLTTRIRDVVQLATDRECVAIYCHKMTRRFLEIFLTRAKVDHKIIYFTNLDFQLCLPTKAVVLVNLTDHHHSASNLYNEQTGKRIPVLYFTK